MVSGRPEQLIIKAKPKTIKIMKTIKTITVLILLMSGISNLKVFDAQNGLLYAQTPSEIRSAPSGIATTNDVDFSPDGSKIATYTKENFIAIWDVETGELLKRLPGQDGYISELDWSPDGKLLASASNNGTVALWNAETGKQVRQLGDFSMGARRAYSGANETEFSPDGRFIAGMQYEPNGEIIVWRVSNGQEVFRLERPMRTFDIGWSASGDWIYTLDQVGQLNIWSFPGGEKIDEINIDNDKLVDLDGTRFGIVATGGSSDTVFIYDVERGEVTYRFSQDDFVNRTAIAQNPARVASAGTDGVMRMWNLETGERIFEQYAHDSINYYVTFSPDQQLLATSGQDNYIRLWDAETGNLVREIQSP
jgi:WD40 repeat protein